MSVRYHKPLRRVLYTNTPSYIGGAEVSILTLMQHLTQERYAPVLLTSSDSTLALTTRQRDIPVVINPLPRFRRRKPFARMLSIIRLIGLMYLLHIDIVHTSCDKSLQPVRAACRLTRLPYVSHIHDFVRDWYKPGNLEALRAARAVITCSKAVTQRSIAAGLESARVRTIYYPIEIDAFSNVTPQEAAAFRAAAHIPADATVIGIVGQVQSIKGHREFMHAALELAANEPAVHFLIVGASFGDEDQRFATEIQDQAKQSPFKDQFHFMGFRSDVPIIMKSLDILAVPSWNEPFGRVTVEGMAAGCAVVGTRAGGTSEIIKDGIDGCLIPPKDAQALCETLHQLICLPELRKQLGSAAVVSAQKYATKPRVAEMESLYDSILQPDRLTI